MGGAALSGHLVVVGLGPGDARYLTPEADAALKDTAALYGYAGYLARIPAREGQARHASDNREERTRAAAALHHAAQGARVAVVSGGDPGVFAMAAAVCEEIEHGPEIFRALDVTFVPGVTAMLAAAAGAGFVIALYNPVSQSRPWQFTRAMERLAGILPPATPVVIGRAVGRADEKVTVTTLDRAGAAEADMATLVIVGSRETRLVQRAGLAPLVYTPRSTAVVNA